MRIQVPESSKIYHDFLWVSKKVFFLLASVILQWDSIGCDKTLSWTVTFFLLRSFKILLYSSSKVHGTDLSVSTVSFQWNVLTLFSSFRITFHPQAFRNLDYTAYAVKSLYRMGSGNRFSMWDLLGWIVATFTVLFGLNDP